MSHTDAASEPGSDVFTPVFQAPDLASVAPASTGDDSTGGDSTDRHSRDQGSTENSTDHHGDEQGGRAHPDAGQSNDQHGDDQQEQDSGRNSNDQQADDDAERGSGSGRSRRKRRRGGRSRSRDRASTGGGADSDSSENETGTSSGGSRGAAADQSSGNAPHSGEGQSSSAAEEDDDAQVIRKRRRRRRGSVDMEIEETEGDEHTVTRVRAARDTSESAPTKVTSVKGSTRLEAKRQRRRSSRDGGRRRQIITEAEFLARRESVDRKMIVRQRGERIQIGVLEDGVLAEHYVSNTAQDSLIGNVYLGKVQNVLPSMEAAFVDIGRGRNAVLYAGEVDWQAAKLGNKPRKIENALKSGDSVLVQVTKDPVGHKGARLTSQVSLPGRYLVFVPGGSMTGISRKLPDTERARLKKILKEQMPENAGVIVRTAAEGASEEELTNDINRLRALWESIQVQNSDKKVLAPEMLYAEPDLTIKVVRDVFNEDFSSMAIQGEETWDSVEAYVTYVAPHLLDRLQKWETDEQSAGDIFAHHRIDEQLHKALDRKVNLPSGGSLVFDRTEAMTVVDINTGKFTGSGGNLEETVTKNNLEAAEEIVRQLRLRDIGGIIVIDFIDMVLESNRDLVLRRLVECLGRDRTKHQVAEVTSLGLVQMTRKRMGTGLLEVFSETCEHCAGSGLITHDEPITHRSSYNSHGEVNRSKPKKRRKGRPRNGGGSENSAAENEPSAEQKEKQEQARQALAQVAAATTGQQDPGDAKKGGSGQAQSTGGQQGPSKGKGRGRTSRNHGEKSSTLTIGGETVPVPHGNDRQPEDSAHQATGPSKKQPAKKQVSLDSLDQAVASRTPAGSDSGAAPRRRRRAAGSVQGASGEVQQVWPESSGPARTFTAAAAEKKPAAQQESAEPVMFGVGVSADQISQDQKDGGQNS